MVMGWTDGIAGAMEPHSMNAENNETRAVRTFVCTLAKHLLFTKRGFGIGLILRGRGWVS